MRIDILAFRSQPLVITFFMRNVASIGIKRVEGDMSFLKPQISKDLI